MKGVLKLQYLIDHLRLPVLDLMLSLKKNPLSSGVNLDWTSKFVLYMIDNYYLLNIIYNEVFKIMTNVHLLWISNERNLIQTKLSTISYYKFWLFTNTVLPKSCKIKFKNIVLKSFKNYIRRLCNSINWSLSIIMLSLIGIMVLLIPLCQILSFSTTMIFNKYSI